MSHRACDPRDRTVTKVPSPPMGAPQPGTCRRGRWARTMWSPLTGVLGEVRSLAPMALWRGAWRVVPPQRRCQSFCVPTVFPRTVGTPVHRP